MDRKAQMKQQKCGAKPKPILTPNQVKLQLLTDKLFGLTILPPEQNISKAIEHQEEINQLIDQVRELEKEIDSKFSTNIRCDAAIVEQFTKWMKDYGAIFEGTKVTEFPGYELGLQADVDIKETSLVIAVPRELMLTTEDVKKSYLGVLCETDPLLSNMPHVALSVFLLLEKFKETSFWKPYIDILPKEYSTVFYFNVDDLKELQASPTLKYALKQMKHIARQYAYFYKLIWLHENEACQILRKFFTYDQYRWAVSTVMTRQNRVPSEDGSDMINALIPLWDLCNHTNGNISTDYNPELKRSECLAVKDFHVGEQILIFYGPRNNAQLFINNGFVYEDNEHDGYWLQLGISKSDQLKEKRLQLLNRLSMSDHAEFWIGKSRELFDGYLVAFLRVFNMDEEQLEHWLKADDVKDLKNLNYNFDNNFENKYWNFLLTRLKLILASYKTKLNEDVKILAEAQLPRYKHLCVQMRITEKRILFNAISYIENLKLKK